MYLTASEAQRNQLARRNITTLRDLFDGANTKARAPRCQVVLCRDLIRFVKYHCDNPHIHLHELVQDGILRRGGKFPDQWLAIKGGNVRLVGFVLNGGLDDDEALRRALEASSMNVVLPSPPAELPFLVTEASDLECPITLERFKDPVTTCNGHTFERDAIEAWLSKMQTDPLTGEVLVNTSLMPDYTMRVLLKRVV